MDNRLNSLCTMLKYATTQCRVLNFGNVTMDYHFNNGWSDPLIPIVHLEHILVECVPPRGSHDTARIGLYTLCNDAIFRYARDVLDSILEDVPVPQPPIPRVKFINASNRENNVNIMQLAADPVFQHPHLYFIYWPHQREGFVITREGERRACYNTTEVIIELLLAHSSLFGFHGTAVRYDQHGVVLTGRSGAGKTSLMLGLLSQGADFLSDDISIITQQGMIVPLEHKELTIRSSTRVYLRKHGRLHDIPEEHMEGWHPSNEVYRYVSDLFSDHLCDSVVTLTTVLLPVYCAEASEARLTRLSPQEAEHALNVSTDFLPWVMQWEAAFGIAGKHVAIWKQLNHWLRTEQVRVLRAEYGADLDRAAADIAAYLLAQHDM